MDPNHISLVAVKLNLPPHACGQEWIVDMAAKLYITKNGELPSALQLMTFLEELDYNPARLENLQQTLVYMRGEPSSSSSATTSSHQQQSLLPPAHAQPSLLSLAHAQPSLPANVQPTLLPTQGAVQKQRPEHPTSLPLRNPESSHTARARGSGTSDESQLASGMTALSITEAAPSLAAQAAATAAALSRRKENLMLRATENEGKYLKRLLTCVLCKRAPAELTFLPCGHFCICSNCSENVDTCPMCRKRVLAEVKTFLA